MKRTSFKTKCDTRNCFIIRIQCEQCGKSLDDDLLISTECLHRFCPSCISSNFTNCPQCGTNTKFELDSNFSRLISKINQCNKTTNKRRIIDVLQNDGADLTTQNNGRWSRMTNGSQAKQRKSQSPNKLSSSHAVGPSTSFTNDALEDKTAYRLSNGEFDSGWTKIGSNLVSHRLPLNRNISKMEAIVLWPDGVNYRIRDLPHCLLRPRYLYVPPIATVAHLTEYLFKRAELEAGAELRFKYKIELMPVESERDEINLWVNPLRDIDYLSIEFKSNMHSNTGEYVLILRKNQEDSYFCTNLIMSHPFKPLAEGRTVAELLDERNNLSSTFINPLHKQTLLNGFMMEQIDAIHQCHQQKDNRPPKFVYRFVPHAAHNM